jgi:NAD(P)-dependent dehydrogenase (short-subunit alcohol dehydrogenase family)
MDDRVAFVTGGAGGIGRATCQAFHDAGYRCALTDLDRTLGAAAAEIDPSGESRRHACDVRRLRQWTPRWRPPSSASPRLARERRRRRRPALGGLSDES